MSDSKGKSSKTGERDAAFYGGEAQQAEVDERELDVVIYPPEGKVTETAQALVQAADAAGYNQQRVQFSDGTFVVPEGLAAAATLPEGTDSAKAADVAQALTEGSPAGQKPRSVAQRAKDDEKVGKGTEGAAATPARRKDGTAADASKKSGEASADLTDAPEHKGQPAKRATPAKKAPAKKAAPRQAAAKKAAPAKADDAKS